MIYQNHKDLWRHVFFKFFIAYRGHDLFETRYVRPFILYLSENSFIMQKYSDREIENAKCNKNTYFFFPYMPFICEYNELYGIESGMITQNFLSYMNKKKKSNSPLAPRRSELRRRPSPSCPKLTLRCIVRGNDKVRVNRWLPCTCHRQFQPGQLEWLIFFN